MNQLSSKFVFCTRAGIAGIALARPTAVYLVRVGAFGVESRHRRPTGFPGSDAREIHIYSASGRRVKSGAW